MTDQLPAIVRPSSPALMTETDLVPALIADCGKRAWCQVDRTASDLTEAVR